MVTCSETPQGLMAVATLVSWTEKSPAPHRSAGVPEHATLTEPSALLGVAVQVGPETTAPERITAAVLETVWALVAVTVKVAAGVEVDEAHSSIPEGAARVSVGLGWQVTVTEALAVSEVVQGEMAVAVADTPTVKELEVPPAASHRVV